MKYDDSEKIAKIIKNFERIIVTGCAGFIGWKVSEMLLDFGKEVIGIDNLNDAYDVRLKEWRLNQLLPRDKFKFYKLDISQKETIFDFFNQINANSGDALINLAARAGVRQSLENPWVYYETNAIGTLNLLECCKNHGIKKFVLASTSSLYGNHNKIPFSEDDDTNGPLSPYAASKKAAETLCFTYHHLYGLDITVFRYFTVYGPAGRPDMSIFRFIKWILEDQPLIIYGDGSQSRDFTYVDDIARGTILGLKSLGYEIINLGSDSPHSLIEIIKIIEELTGKKAEMKHEPFHKADVEKTWAETGIAKSILEWKPNENIKNGLKKSIVWANKNIEFIKNISIK
jgi:nucleoside-diphosphate-sugar epimerase